MTLPRYVAPELQTVSSFISSVFWSVRDQGRLTQLLSEASKVVEPGIYLGDNFFTWGRNNSLFDDVAFRSAWESNVLHDADRGLGWRRYVLATLAFNAAELDGDFVECGVYQGTGLKTVLDYLGGPAFPKMFWGYDAFDYNPEDHPTFGGRNSGFFELVSSRFFGYENVKLVKGVVPETFAAESPEKIAFLHIDLADATREVAVLDHLFERVVPGGVIIFDDYEWAGSHRAQKLALDPWFDAHRYRITPLPTGQGLVHKR